MLVFLHCYSWCTYCIIIDYGMVGWLECWLVHRVAFSFSFSVAFCVSMRYRVAYHVTTLIWCVLGEPLPQCY